MFRQSARLISIYVTDHNIVYLPKLPKNCGLRAVFLKWAIDQRLLSVEVSIQLSCKIVRLFREFFSYTTISRGGNWWACRRPTGTVAGVAKPCRVLLAPRVWNCLAVSNYIIGGSRRYCKESAPFVGHSTAGIPMIHMPRDRSPPVACRPEQCLRRRPTVVGHRKTILTRSAFVHMRSLAVIDRRQRWRHLAIMQPRFAGVILRPQSRGELSRINVVAETTD